jgi:hypothetical protein
VRAARDLFAREPLRRIKRARAETEPAVNRVTEVAHRAAATSTRHLVLLTGVPGAGKTLVGLQLVHAGFRNTSGRSSVVRSGRTPVTFRSNAA